MCCSCFILPCGYLYLEILTDVFTVSAQVKLFVTGLFSLNQDIPAFKEHLRDFLVQIKVCLAWFLTRIVKKIFSRMMFLEVIVQCSFIIGCIFYY